jgi:4,5-DOPA dioxygenase extradiol
LTPALFVSHGAPSVVLEDDGYTRALASYGKRFPRPDAIVVISAHWEARGPVHVNAVAHPGVIYDFAGFPRELYALDYLAPGAPALANDALRHLASARIEAVAEMARDWDHGLWVPLRMLFPEATIPVVEVSMPVARTPELLFHIGEALRPLRSRGVLLIGSGGIVHNLRLLHWGDKEAAVDPWAADFDEWVAERIERRAVEDLLAYRLRAPRADLAAPTTEHLDPLFFILGAATEEDRALSVFAGFHYGNLSMRTFALGS